MPSPDLSLDLEPYGSPARSEWLDVDWAAHRRSVTVSGSRVNYVRMGEGPAVLFIHGLAGSWRNWLENIPHIARDHTAIAVDLPGFGESDPPQGEVCIAGYAAFVATFLEALGVPQATLVGSSMGGLIAAATAAATPDRVHSLVLVRVASHYEAAIPASRKAILPETGHAPMIERPAAFNRLLHSYLTAT